MQTEKKRFITNMELINYNHVNICQQEKEILDDVTFSLNEGEFAYIVGEVGSGKSSLLKTMYGEVDVKQGDAFVFDYNMRTIKRKEIPALRRRIGIVFQDFQLLLDRNIEDNLDFVLKATGWKKKEERKQRITEVLNMIKLSTKGYKMPNELSGGEQQRVVIARAILNKPSLILADEPTGNLDAETGRLIVKLLHDICAQGSSVIMITHQEQWLQEFPATVFRCQNKKFIKISTNTPLEEPEVETQQTIDSLNE